VTEHVLGALIEDTKLRMMEKQTSLTKGRERLSINSIAKKMKKEQIKVVCQLILTIPSLCCSPNDRTSSQFGVESHPSLSRRYSSRTFSRIVFR